MSEPGTEAVVGAMQEADTWFICRHGFVETARAVGIAAGEAAVKTFAGEWPAFVVIEIDQALSERAAALALKHDLRSLDSLHLAAALTLSLGDVTIATWDHRLHRAAGAEDLECLPSRI